MDKYQGDLTDIVRASGGALGQPDFPAVSNGEFLITNPTSTFPTVMEDDRPAGVGGAFGDPFCNMRDPLLQELNGAGSSYFGSPNSIHRMLPTSIDNAASFCGAPEAANSSHLLAHHHHHVFEENIQKTPTSIFQQIQISPGDPAKLPMSSCQSPVMAPATSSPRGFKTCATVTSDMINVNSSKSCLLDKTGPVQIPSPRNLGIKRRKSQAKKVVCIPAPAAPNSRSSSGEIVPSDLWAWRKYGQKPIKGSPYPRGYYRCSSSKGCSARKQVERSRADPNMLVITYTSEHNHPWPTQRNALAGSTRSQPPKNINNASSKSTTESQIQTSDTNEEQKGKSNDALSPSTMKAGTASSSTANTGVKEEIDDIERQLEMDDNDFISEGFPQSYRPEMPETSHSADVFAELGEIEAEPFELLFTSRFAGDGEQKDVGALDSFSGFDWTCFEQGKNKSL